MGTTNEDLLDYHGPSAPLLLDVPPIYVTLDNLRLCMVTAPPLSSPYKDGWRVEHLISLAVDLVCGEALATFMTVVVKGEVSQKIANLHSLFSDTCYPP